MKKFNWLFSMILVLCIILVFTTSGMAKVVIKYAHMHNPGIAYYDAAAFFAEKVEELSGGEIVCEVYPSGQLGGDREIVESIKMGNLHMNHPNFATLSLLYPKISIYSLPFLFKDFEHAKRVFTSEIGEKLASEFEEATGLILTDALYAEPPRGLYTDIGPIYEPEQMEGKKIRIMESEIYRDMFGELGVGALPTPVPYTELYTALATNLVEFADPPIDTYYSGKFYEVAKYYSFSDHEISVHPITIGSKWFNGLSKENQNIILEALKQTSEFQVNLSESQQQGIIEWLTCNGVRINFVNKCAFKEAMTPVYDKWTEKLGVDFATEFIENANKLGEVE